MTVIRGLTVDEQRVVNQLEAQLDAKARRNQLRSAYMDGKHALRQLPPTIPPYLRNIGMVLGWPAKAVEALARRARLVEFSIPGRDLTEFGLDEILTGNDYYSEARISGLSSLEHSVAWQITTRGDTAAGDPEVVISRKSALNGTGEWSSRARQLVNFLSVVDRDKQAKMAAFNLYLPKQVIVCKDGAVVERLPSSLPRIPVEPLVYRRRDGRPFGSSRISRPIMALTNSAVRSILRSEGTADFYSIPTLALFGPDESFFEGNPTWKMLLNGIFSVPDNDEAETTRATLTQLTQASQQPHVDQLEVWAQLFAAEASIPVSSLGIGMTQANPTSAESYLASREDLISEAEDTIDGWRSAHVRTLQNAWMIREGATTLPVELRNLQANFRDPRHESKSAAADWFLKVTTSMPWIADTDAAVKLIGLDETTVAQLLGERDRDKGMANLRTILDSAAANPATTADQPASATDEAIAEANLMRARFDALGVAIRAGADPEDAAARVGLLGLKFTGAVPVSLRVPDNQAAALESK
ncbi:SPP1 Gp6-like portal protein [Propionicimonas paludicola]|uniref:SPP1 Gp6-like portal protein n=1 Tax=Propionicimonas paludicola TaxID=185243 RepID=A0A2A9CQ67_9ACTN|nr:phage portal protein [Propionicimonas paludicola]PFG16286.1 SPP1 Gp6-like portal protein [Propionicimonas paludicola]